MSVLRQFLAIFLATKFFLKVLLTDIVHFRLESFNQALFIYSNNHMTHSTDSTSHFLHIKRNYILHFCINSSKFKTLTFSQFNIRLTDRLSYLAFSKTRIKYVRQVSTCQVDTWISLKFKIIFQNLIVEDELCSINSDTSLKRIICFNWCWTVASRCTEESFNRSNS